MYEFCEGTPPKSKSKVGCSNTPRVPILPGLPYHIPSETKTILLIASSQEQSTSGIASQVSVVITPSLDIFKGEVAKLKH